jgi:uncharacterized protein YuzE
MSCDHQILYDQEANAIYVRLTDAHVAESIALDELDYVDVDENGAWVGIEILGIGDPGSLIAGMTPRLTS